MYVRVDLKTIGILMVFTSICFKCSAEENKECDYASKAGVAGSVAGYALGGLSLAAGLSVASIAIPVAFVGITIFGLGSAIYSGFLNKQPSTCDIRNSVKDVSDTLSNLSTRLDQTSFSKDTISKRMDTLLNQQKYTNFFKKTEYQRKIKESLNYLHGSFDVKNS